MIILLIRQPENHVSGCLNCYIDSVNNNQNKLQMLKTNLTDTQNTLEHTAQMLKAMSHPERLAILLELSRNEASLQELSQYTGLSPTQLSAHLTKMRQLGMVDYTRFMRIVQYRITSDMVRSVLKTLPQYPLERK